MPRYTKGGKKTKMASFEDKVDAAKLPGGEREKYAIANKIGLKRGSKTTARGMRPAKAKKPRMMADEHKLRKMRMPA